MAQLRGKKWQVNFRHGSKFLRPTFDTEVEAKSWEALAKVARSQGLPLPPTATDASISVTRLGVFISEYFEDLWGANKSRKKYMEYCAQLTDHFGSDKAVADITTAEVDSWIRTLKSYGNSDKTINRKLSVLSKMLKHALKRELISKMPIIERRKEGVGRKRFLTDAEEKDLLATLDRVGEFQAAKRCQFMIYTGARDGEVRNLQWSDIHGRVVVLDGKTGLRSVVLSKKAKEALSWAKEQGYSKPFPMSYTSFKEAWDAASVRLKKDATTGWVPYIMRHTCASRLVQRGVDIRRVKEWMGHSTITTTMTYAHLAPGDLAQCADALDA